MLKDKTTHQRFKDYDQYYIVTKSAMRIMPGLCRMIGKFIKGDVLDIGSGDGIKLKQIIENSDIKRINHVLAIEPSPLFKKLKKNLTSYKFINVSKESFYELNNNKKFDVILMFEVIEHIFNPSSALGKIKKLLKNKGILIGSTPNRPIYHLACFFTKEHDPTHINEMNIRELKILLNKYFKINQFKGFFPLARLFRKFPALDFINKYCPLFLSRTIYFFSQGKI